MPGVSVVDVTPKVQQYAWGKAGKDSAVASLFAAGSGVTVEADKPYAELWMGTHPSGPSRVSGSDQLLRDYLEADLPYLFKV